MAAKGKVVAGKAAESMVTSDSGVELTTGTTDDGSKGDGLTVGVGDGLSGITGAGDNWLLLVVVVVTGVAWPTVVTGATELAVMSWLKRFLLFLSDLSMLFSAFE